MTLTISVVPETCRLQKTDAVLHQCQLPELTISACGGTLLEGY